MNESDWNSTAIAKEDDSRSPAERALLDLHGEINQLEELAVLLSKRLHAVMRPSDVTQQDSEMLAAVRTVASPHVESLRGAGESVRHVQGQLNVVLNRLEI